MLIVIKRKYKVQHNLPLQLLMRHGDHRLHLMAWNHALNAVKIDQWLMKFTRIKNENDHYYHHYHYHNITIIIITSLSLSQHHYHPHYHHHYHFSWYLFDICKYIILNLLSLINHLDYFLNTILRMGYILPDINRYECVISISKLLTVPPHRAHIWQIHFVQVSQYTLSFSLWYSQVLLWK